MDFVILTHSDEVMPPFYQFGRYDRFASATDNAALSMKEPPLGTLPEWNLTDLYPSVEAPAFTSDLARAESECKIFAESYKGKLASLAVADGGQGLVEAVKRYEALDDLMGRIMSFASLAYYADTSDPARAKFFGDTQEKINAASTDLLFFQLELNRLDDATIEKLVQGGPLTYYRPWLEDIRKDKPYELSDEIERLFHEKSVTGRSAWNRLFDETIAR